MVTIEKDITIAYICHTVLIYVLRIAFRSSGGFTIDSVLPKPLILAGVSQGSILGPLLRSHLCRTFLPQ